MSLSHETNAYPTFQQTWIIISEMFLAQLTLIFGQMWACQPRYFTLSRYICTSVLST